MMKSRIVLIILAFALSAFFLAGCSDKSKDNPTRPQISEEGLANWLNAWQFFSIFFSTSHDPGWMVSRAYTPPGYDYQGGGGRPYPVLYLLSPFRGDERYYLEHGLGEVADRLLAEGRIQPMIIVCIDGQSQMGGSFYTDSPYQGKYYSSLLEDEDFYVDIFDDPDGTYTGNWPFDYRGPWTFKSKAMIPRIDKNGSGYNTIDDPNTRAISGVGMGGYGAFALAVKTGLFGSVSAVNAPLDFDGTGGSEGLITLLNESRPAAWADIDTSLGNPALSLIVSAAAAFTPHYTDFQIDSVYVRERDSVLTFVYTPLDSLTDDLSSYLPDHQIHVPYDPAGGINSFIWDLWMEHNIQNIYEADVDGYAAHFDDVKKLLVRSQEAKYHYGEQMDGFIQWLQDKNDANYTVMEFTGNDNLSATADHFLYDILEDILIFHSDNFVIPGDIE
jgi:S-formylglutathione hydrolase FrmB